MMFRLPNCQVKHDGFATLSTLLLKVCHKKQENFYATLQPLISKDFAADQIIQEYFKNLGCGH
jgi:hypothetical protein